MNKYTGLSDFEINKKVAEKLLIPHYVIKDKVLNAGHDSVYDPCNSPAAAMPIINEYGISLVYQNRKFQFATNDGNIECSVSNPLKAAMIIFLCVKDAENES